VSASRWICNQHLYKAVTCIFKASPRELPDHQPAAAGKDFTNGVITASFATGEVSWKTTLTALAVQRNRARTACDSERPMAAAEAGRLRMIAGNARQQLTRLNKFAM
jgi:hypothetical protein